MAERSVLPPPCVDAEEKIVYDKRKFISELMESEAAIVQDDDIFYVTGRARRVLEHACQALMQQSGLRKVELDILYFLSRKDSGDTARDIMESRSLSKAHISKSVDNLRRTGCVTLMADPADRRCVHLHLTDKGFALAASYAAIVHRVCRQLLCGVTPQERQAIRSAMEKIRRNIVAADNTLARPGQTEDTP